MTPHPRSLPGTKVVGLQGLVWAASSDESGSFTVAGE